MKKTLTILTIAIAITTITACKAPWQTQEDYDRSELKSLVAQQAAINAAIKQKIDTLNSYEQIDKYFEKAKHPSTAPTVAAPVAPSPKPATVPTVPTPPTPKEK